MTVLRRVPVVLALVAALGLVACGQSKEEKAKKSVCDARAHVGQQVDHLKGLTVTTATTADVQNSLQAIRNDLSKITNAQGDLNDQRRKQVQSANDAFKSQLQSITASAGKSLSLSNAGAQLTAAAQELANSYRQTLARVDCS